MDNEKTPPQSSALSVHRLQETIISVNRIRKAKSVLLRALQRLSNLFKKPSKKENLSLHLPELIEEKILSLHLPGLIEEEILSRLLVKVLLRFRCVSKPWRSLIDSKSFIKLHFQSHDSWKTILQCCEHGFRQHGPDQSSYNSYWDEPLLAPSPINDPQNNHLMYGVVVGCSNGLLCVINRPCTFFLWNPAIKSAFELPKAHTQNLPIKKWGFGWDEESDAYKLFVAMYDRNNKGIAQVYSSNTNSWRSVEYGSRSLIRKRAKLACGKIHWLARSGEHVYIETFDLKSEVFGTIELPHKPKKGDRIWLLEIKGSLRVVCDIINDNAKCRAWVMEEYGVKESWVEKILTLDKNSSCCRPIFYRESLASPLLFKKN